jgi:hypothetical protein
MTMEPDEQRASLPHGSVATHTNPGLVEPRMSVVDSDVDSAGNVTLWDHGPPEEEKATHEDWHKHHGAGPVPAVLDAQQARHALTADPARYSLEPLGEGDAEVAAEVEAIRRRREETKKASEDHVAKAQLAADRKAAVAAVMATRRAKEHKEAADKKAVKYSPLPPAQSKPFWDRAETKTADSVVPPPVTGTFSVDEKK